MKIAVCISGRMSGFDVTSKLFEHWNSIYDNVEFYFFISYHSTIPLNSFFDTSLHS